MTGLFQIAAQTLRAIRSDLETIVTPELSSSSAKSTVWMIGNLLEHLIVRLDDHEHLTGDVIRGYRQLDNSDAAAPGKAFPDAAQAQAELAALYAIMEGLIVSGGSETSDRKRIVALELQHCARERDMASHVTQDQTTAIDTVEVEVDKPRLQAMLDAHACGAPALKVTGFSRAGSGYSKDTFFLDAHDQNGSAVPLVIRRDLPFGPTNTTVADEFSLLQALAKKDLPIAEPLFLERQLLGTSAMIVRRIGGTPGIDSEQQPKQVLAICDQLAAIMAQLHNIDPAEAGLAIDADPAATLRAYICTWRDHWLQHREESSPTIALALNWLMENVPANLESVSIIHGDIGFHNMLIENGHVSALLDWEFAHVGEPAEDLEYCRQAIEPLMPWSAFMERYIAHGGKPYSEVAARFYKVWRDARNAVCCAVSWGGFLRGQYPALKLAQQGIPLYQLFVQQTAQSLMEQLDVQSD